MTEHAGRPALSVVVMGYRNESTISGAVLSVLEQGHDEAIEVLAVTSGRDHSAEVVRERCPGVRVIESADRLFPGAARNAGVRAARGEFVAFLAADCRAAPGWVAARLTAHRAGYAAVAAAVMPEEPWSAAAWAGHYLLFPSRLAGAPSEEVAYPDDRVHGLSYAKELLERVGPFREDLRIGEDTEMARRLGEGGTPIWLAADAVVIHRGPRRIRGLVRDQYLRGMRNAKFVGPPPARGWSRTRAALGAVRGTWERLRWSQQRVMTFAPDHRHNLVRVGPCMVAGILGHQAGWGRARLAAIACSSDPNRSVVTPLSRWAAARRSMRIGG
ncbi:MAG: glycosyltransferase [Actinomycetota bacterium]|nr:glycosyltransferase [Actinomycetota bacterium]